MIMPADLSGKNAEQMLKLYLSDGSSFSGMAQTALMKHCGIHGHGERAEQKHQRITAVIARGWVGPPDATVHFFPTSVTSADRGVHTAVKSEKHLFATSHPRAVTSVASADRGGKVGLTLFSTSWWVLTDRGRTEDSGVKVGLTLFSTSQPRTVTSKS